MALHRGFAEGADRAVALDREHPLGGRAIRLQELAGGPDTDSADLALAESRRLVAGARLSCSITVFGGADDAIDRAALRAWSDFTTGAFRVRMFPGGHFYLAEADEALIGEIVEALRRPESLRGPQSAGVDA